MSRRGRPKHADILTPREWEVLGLIREGLSNEQIAQRLGISVDGAKFHVSEILTKLGLENRHDAARWRPEEARPWWAVAVAPLLLWRRLNFGWLSPVITGAVVAVAAAGIGLLVWALLATRGGGLGESPTLALPAGDRIAYVGDDGNLWLVEGDGPARRLTDFGAVSWLRWSPDGRYVLFLYDEAKPLNPPPAGWEPKFSLWLADAESGDVRRLASGPVSFSDEPWSPDRRRIAYSAHGVWVTDTEGAARQVVPGDFAAGDVAWSPDGERLVVARQLPPDYPEDWNQPGAHVEVPPENGLYIVDADGGEPEPIALVEAIQKAWDTGMGLAQHPAGQPDATGVTGVGGIQWSPDGGYLAFQPVTLSASLMADGVGLLTVSVDGGPPVYHGTMLRSQGLLDWFPGGHRFVFTLGGGRDVYIGKRLALAEAGIPGAQVIAEEPERLPTPPNPIGQPPALSIRSDAWPAVSPDGTRIAFQASQASWTVPLRLDIGKIEGPKEGIWVVNADGSDPRQLTSDPDHLDFFPRWSADGELIMFLRTDGRPFLGDFAGEGSARAEIWIARADGGETRRLVPDAQRISSYYGLFSWESYVAWHRAD